MYILNKNRGTGCLTVTESWGSATQNARKVDVRWRNFAGGKRAVSHLTYTIPDRNSGAAAALQVSKTDVCTGPWC